LHADNRSGALGNDALYDNAAIAHLAKHDAHATHDGHGTAGGGQQFNFRLQTGTVVKFAGAEVVQGAAGRNARGLGGDWRCWLIMNAVLHAAELVRELGCWHQVGQERSFPLFEHCLAESEC
jgi:hypothetical protein